MSRVFPQIIQLDDLQRDRVLVWNCGYIFIYLIFASPEKANKKTQTESFVIRLSVGSTSTPVHVNNTVLSALSNGRFQINWRWTLADRLTTARVFLVYSSCFRLIGWQGHFNYSITTSWSGYCRVEWQFYATITGRCFISKNFYIRVVYSPFHSKI